MQSLFQQNVSLTLRLLVITILCVVLMTVDHRNNALKGFRSTVGSYLVYPLQYFASLPSRLFQSTDTTIVTRKQLLADNALLRRENLELKAQLLKLESLEQENARLRTLMRASSAAGEEILIAEVVSVDQDKEQIVINKGEEHHVHVSQPVIDAQGVMGQVIEVNRSSSAVLLISDPGHALPVQSIRGGIRSIAQGKGKGNANELALLYIPNNTDLKPGDLLITSGLGGVFPRNYPVAVVSEVIVQNNQPFAEVTATPTALLDKSREVLLIWPKVDPQ
jgi:rod shape-determining protein MreC